MRRGAPHCGALQPCAPQKKKAGPAGRGDVRRAGGGSGGPGVAPRPPAPRPPPVTGRLRNPRSSRNVHPEPTRFSKKRKKHPFAKIIEKAPFHYTDIQWPHDQRDQAGGKT